MNDRYHIEYTKTYKAFISKLSKHYKGHSDYPTAMLEVMRSAMKEFISNREYHSIDDFSELVKHYISGGISEITVNKFYDRYHEEAQKNIEKFVSTTLFQNAIKITNWPDDGINNISQREYILEQASTGWTSIVVTRLRANSKILYCKIFSNFTVGDRDEIASRYLYRVEM